MLTSWPSRAVPATVQRNGAHLAHRSGGFAWGDGAQNARPTLATTEGVLDDGI